MQDSPRPLPGWFRAVFITVMLLLCAVLCWFAFQQDALHFQIADLTASLDTSRQREAKQRFEYNEVITALPQAEAAAAELIPQAEASLTAESELRAQRKALRKESADLAQKLAEVQAEAEALAAQEETLRSDIAALLELKQQLEAQLAALSP